MPKYEIHPKAIEASKEPSLYKVELTEGLLRELQQQYHEVRGHPAFLRGFLAADPHSNAIRMQFNHPELISWAKDGSFVLMPNYPYIDRDALENDPKHYKDRKGGLSLNAWFVHPKQLEESIFSNPEIRANPMLIKSHYDYVPALENSSDIGRSNDQKRIRELEKESGTPYIASVLDLKKENLPWLKSLKASTLENLKDAYGVTTNDKVDLFFHGIISQATTTLHLHARVNQEISPIEKQNSIELDEIINGLENGKTVSDMMLEKKVIYHGIVEKYQPDAIKSATKVENPFLPKRSFVDLIKGTAYKLDLTGLLSNSSNDGSYFLPASASCTNTHTR